MSVIRGLRWWYGPTVPMVVHSSAGDGRSSIVIIMEMLMYKVDYNHVSRGVISI